MKALKLLFTLVAALVISVSFSFTASASKIAKQGDTLYCVNCYKNKTVPVAGADAASFYSGVIETKHYAFIQLDEGSSCYGGGWSAIDKRAANPTAVKFETSCNEITNVKAFESNGNAYLKFVYYNGKTVTYRFKL